MEYIVQKYGGTSIGRADRMRSVAEIVKNSIQHSRVIVVLSAMSSYVKAEGTTSKLIEASEAALSKGSYSEIIDSIEQQHLSVINELISGMLQEKVAEAVDLELKSLKSFLDAISVIGEISPRSQDVIIGTGEKLSARIFAGLLCSMGIDAAYVNLDSVVGGSFQEANKEFYSHVKGRLI